MIWVGKRVIMPSQWTLESFELHENTPISISLSTLVMRLLPKAETTFFARQCPLWRTKNCAISHPRLNEGTFIREYSKSGQETMDTKMI